MYADLSRRYKIDGTRLSSGRGLIFSCGLEMIHIIFAIILAEENLSVKSGRIKYFCGGHTIKFTQYNLLPAHVVTVYIMRSSLTAA